MSVFISVWKTHEETFIFQFPVPPHIHLLFSLENTYLSFHCSVFIPPLLPVNCKLCPISFLFLLQYSQTLVGYTCFPSNPSSFFPTKKKKKIKQKIYLPNLSIHIWFFLGNFSVSLPRERIMYSVSSTLLQTMDFFFFLLLCFRLC